MGNGSIRWKFFVLSSASRAGDIAGTEGSAFVRRAAAAPPAFIRAAKRATAHLQKQMRRAQDMLRESENNNDNKKEIKVKQHPSHGRYRSHKHFHNRTAGSGFSGSDL